MKPWEEYQNKQESGPWNEYKVEPSFTEGVKSDLSKRAGEFVTSALDPNKPITTLPFRYASALGGAAGDVALRGLKEITPEPIQKAVKSGVEYVAGLPPVQYAAEKAGEFKQAYPNVTDILAGGATLMGAPVATKVGKEGLGSAGKAALKINEKKLYPTFSEVKKTSGELYKKAAELGAEFTPEATNEWISRASKDIPTDEFARDVIGTDEVTDFIGRLSQQSGKPMTLETFDALDKKLGDLSQRNFLTAPDISRRYGELQNDLRDVVMDEKFIAGQREGVDSLREATRLWGISKKMEDIDSILEKAQYYDVPASAIKTGFRRIASDPRKLRGYTPAEQFAIKKAAKTGSLEGVLKTFGSRLLSIGGAVGAGPKGAAAGHIISGAGRAGAEAIKKGQASKVSKSLAERSGLVTTQERINTERLKEIMKMKPKGAINALRGNR